MSVLNYTTQIASEKTVSEMQTMLSKAGASAILTEYREGVLDALSFRIPSKFGVLSFRLPANVDKMFAVICRDKRIQGRLRTREQAGRVAWRVLKDWLAAQLTLVAAEMVEIEQVFLPYAQDANGQTVYEVLKEGRFSGLALTDGK